ncbi:MULTISPECIES: putative toxin-antitoxin system toxin component, PIN family [unclassified Nodularia (in: cyanobacteria)]|uniref:putative toxin-antitoxin system toxin component, PIN family n=1 Tax=unclassified Nodularia (in: cyanobacteria) TaxID=2656917 RepID=UPI00187EF5CC|nr:MULTISPECIES: putative toxin-antitoxin system toxin component, PIN family [unclassified Nodularia (in: cyanobacteria)]MBE9197963.1 putative toxin-antitoxin system toxin component, PIN family [Nodularia sp. LEGE 06071]MCC2691731.1 putative toxin-antitoxin system toxin component, PIN family [Nodularia sp. LEGE 04288]
MRVGLRVVIDTNIIVSALIFGGRISRIRFAWQDNRFTPLVSKATTTELIRVLAYPKFQLTPIEQEDLLSDYILFCEAVAIPNVLPIIPECRDPFDVPFLLLAVVGEADYLVTGDRDLLSLKDNFSRPIITAEDFLNVIDGRSS